MKNMLRRVGLALAGIFVTLIGLLFGALMTEVSGIPDAFWGPNIAGKVVTIVLGAALGCALLWYAYVMDGRTEKARKQNT